MTPQQRITDKVLQSSKYKDVNPSVVRRIAEDTLNRYGEKRAVTETKRILHQVWGIYFKDKPQKLTKVSELDTLLSLHQSSYERLPILNDFYSKIFAVTGQPEVIVDYACGLNPLAVCTLKLTSVKKYYCFDIDTFTVGLLNRWFKLLPLEKVYEANTTDLLDVEPKLADVALLLKVLPPLELQKKGCSAEIIEEQKSRFVVVSYPTKSVSGRNRGMLDFYRQQFAKVCAGKDWRISELVFDNELVYVIEKWL